LYRDQLEDDSDETMNEILQVLILKVVKFNKLKEKSKVTDDQSLTSKIKNVKLQNIQQKMTEKNLMQFLQKMLKVMISDITVENLLIFTSMTHKMMFELIKSDIVNYISLSEKIQINSTQVHLKKLLYFSVSLYAVVKIEKVRISVLLNTEVKVNLIKKSLIQRLKILFTVDEQLRLVNINEEKTVL